MGSNETPIGQPQLEESPSLRPERRKTIYLPGEVVPSDAFTRQLSNGSIEILYRPLSEKNRTYHASTLPKLIMEGPRGTGKSHTMRWDFHMRAMAYPGYKYLMMRRTMPELRKSHLLYLEADMDKLGGRALGVRSGNVEAHYPNGSIGLFGHCETEADVVKYLSAQFDGVGFDEITTFLWDMVTRISTCCRVTDSRLTAIIRGGTNPLGESADDVYHYFIARDVTREEDPYYNPADWGSLNVSREDAQGAVDYDQYDKQFVGLSTAYREAWVEGKWGVEGAYFDIRPEHTLPVMPNIMGSEGLPPRMALLWPWLHIYRVFDYGFHDPSVCIWIAVLPNGRYIAFKEMSWVRRTAQQIIPDIIRESEGMKIITTIADPTLWEGEQEMGHCMANIFEDGMIPLTAGVNDRVAAGFAIQELLNTNLPDGEPQLQFLESCTTLTKTMRSMRIDKKHPGRIADSKVDHMPIALGYFAMNKPSPTHIPHEDAARPWMRATTNHRPVLGADSVRSRANRAYRDN